jgi:5S rRNA maturation endonuclease (ribonuclease M5)
MARSKRSGDGGESRRMSRTVQRRATPPLPTTIGPSSPTDLLRAERRFEELASFLMDLIGELNALSAEGAAVLVEGKRDYVALRGLGYTGPLYTISILNSSALAREKLRTSVTQMVILTDLDSEGRRLASRYVKFLSNEGIRASLAQRRRLSRASRGVFLHIENLRRFAPDL